MFNKLYDKIKQFILENYKSLIILFLIVFCFWYELPFVIYTPGGVVPLEERIEIDKDVEIDGSLNMSYVSLVKGTLPMILLSYVIPNWDLIKSSEVTSEDSVGDLLKLEKLYMESSINNATILAFHEAGKDLNITKQVNNIIYIDEIADTNLKVYDELLKADGVEIDNISTLKEVLNKKNVEDNLILEVRRNGKIKECNAIVKEVDGELKIGIAFLTTYEYETDPEINIKTKSSESGSSGGLMLSLAIYNALIEEDITKGRIIVGTGTIDSNGNVGEIDGIKYKLLGAEKNKADIFLCPVENYEEALSVKRKYDLTMDIYSVETFSQALEILEK